MSQPFCERCNGVLHLAKFWDLKTSGTGFYQYTCINCGNVIDDRILHNRALKTLPKSSKELKRDRRILWNKKPGSYVRKDYNQSVPPIRMDHL
jgi:hypothetical protein